MGMDVVDCERHGAEKPCVEIELDLGAATGSEAGSRFIMGAGFAMDTSFHDGSGADLELPGQQRGADKRLVTGEWLFSTGVAAARQAGTRRREATLLGGLIAARRPLDGVLGGDDE